MNGGTFSLRTPTVCVLYDITFYVRRLFQTIGIMSLGSIYLAHTN